MRRASRGPGLVILIIAFVLAAVMAIYSGVAGRADFLRRSLKTALTPLEKSASWLADRARSDPATRETVDALNARVAELELTVAELEKDDRSAQAALAENARFRELLELKRKNEDFSFAEADVVAGSSSAWRSELTLGAGEKQGVFKDMCVVTATGYVVGLVTDAGSGWATVSTLLDGGVSIGARVFRSGETGVTGGEYSLLADGKLMMRYFSGSGDVRAGDVIVTSGSGGLYPAGLEIGVVTEVISEDGGLSVRAIIEPSAKLGALEQAFVITDFESSGEA